MPSSAFVRSQQFLRYHRYGYWLSLASSILSSILFVALIMLLGLFIDLLVDRGNIGSYYQLPRNERYEFVLGISLPEDREARETQIRKIHEELKVLGIDTKLVARWEAREPIENWSREEPGILWVAALPLFLESRVSAGAAEKIREDIRDSIINHGLEATIYLGLDDGGLLSMVIRSRHGFRGAASAWIARWNAWTWVHGDVGYLVRLLILAFCVAGIRFALVFLSNYAAALAVADALTRLRRAIYHHTLRLGALAFRSTGSAEAVSVSTRHVETLHEGLHRWLTVSVREPVKIGLLIALTFLVSFWLAVALMLLAILVWILGGLIRSHFRAQSREAEGQSAEQLVRFQESLTLMRLIKVYLMESFSQGRMEEQLSGYSEGQLARHRAEALSRPLVFALGSLAAIVLMLVAGLVIVSAHLSFTSTLVLASSVIAMYWPVRSILEMRRNLPGLQASAKIVFDFLDRQGGVSQEVEAEFVPALKRTLQFDKVSVREPGTGRKLLAKISFTIRAGQRVGIVGLDDMEKHAIVNLLVRFLDPTEGEIRLDGKSLRWVTLDSLRNQFGFVMQQNLIFNDTVANNIGCGDPSYNLHRITDAAKIAHAHQFIARLPKGYETPIGELGHSLDSGEKFRIALARAILREPAILVIEEPLNSLSEDVKHMIDDTYQRFLPGRTVIFLPHRLSTIRSCDQILLIHEGKLEADGQHRELVAASDLYRHIQYMEFNEFSGNAASTGDEAAN